LIVVSHAGVVAGLVPATPNIEAQRIEAQRVECSPDFAALNPD
jgi:hypothetical protein